ncbi:Tyrosine kinase catalytic domain protein [Ceratobasidium sp. AG-Ba]|nr:Tyrosine kinase catalytic domain protein [Ceratobasidium sp. AG-Ba]
MASLWMDNGSLPSYLAKHPNINRHDMSTQVCNGLAYLHKNHIVHGDMKGSNILVSKDGIPMINDFGNAVLRSGIQLVADTTQKHWHTPQWTAPELMDGRQNTNTLEADIYSLGMTILEIITGKIPYSEKTNVHAIYVAKVVTKDIPLRPEDVIPSNQYGNSVWSLLKSCWLYEPEMRPKASQVAEDMKKAQGNFVIQKWHGEIYYSLQTKHDCAPVQLKFNVTIQSEPDLDIGLNRWPQKWATTAGFTPMTRATATRLYSSNLPTGHLIDPSHVAPGYSNYAMFRKIIMAGHSIFYADPRLPTIEPGSARGVILFSIPNDPSRIFLKAFIKQQCPAELCRPGQTFGLMCPKDGVDADGYRGIRKLLEQISRPASI